MSLSLHKKRVTITGIVTAVIVLGGGTAAFAYWSAEGSGTGSATTGTSVEFTVTSTPPTDSALVPGGDAVTVPFTVLNPGSASQRLTSVAVTVASDEGTEWESEGGGCSASDYTVGTPVFTTPDEVPGEVAGGAKVEGTVTITMRDRNVSQDGCKGADVPLYFLVR